MSERNYDKDAAQFAIPISTTPTPRASEPTKVCQFCGAAASILDNHPAISCIRNLVSQRDDETQRAEAAEAELVALRRAITEWARVKGRS